jgi:hypothetical protein
MNPPSIDEANGAAVQPCQLLPRFAILFSSRFPDGERSETCRHQLASCPRTVPQPSLDPRSMKNALA